MRAANDSLDTLRHLQPNSGDTQAAERVVQRRVSASAADPGVSVYGDSSGLEVQRLAPHAIVQWSTGTTVNAGYTHEMLTAPAEAIPRRPTDARMRSTRRSGSPGAQQPA